MRNFFYGLLLLICWLISGCTNECNTDGDCEPGHVCVGSIVQYCELVVTDGGPINYDAGAGGLIPQNPGATVESCGANNLAFDSLNDFTVGYFKFIAGVLTNGDVTIAWIPYDNSNGLVDLTLLEMQVDAANRPIVYEDLAGTFRMTITYGTGNPINGVSLIEMTDLLGSYNFGAYMDHQLWLLSWLPVNGYIQEDTGSGIVTHPIIVEQGGGNPHWQAQGASSGSMELLHRCLQ
jgi:hypothetical protein